MARAFANADSKANIPPFLDRLPKALSIPILYVSHDTADVARLALAALMAGLGPLGDDPPSV